MTTAFAPDQQGQASAMVLDGRTLQSSYVRGPRSSYDGCKRKRGRKVHAVDTLNHLLAVRFTSGNEQERAQIIELCKAVQAAIGHRVELTEAHQS